MPSLDRPDGLDKPKAAGEHLDRLVKIWLRLRFATPAGLRGHIDDLAARSARDHVLGDRLQGEEQALHIDGEHFVETRFRHFDDRRQIEYGRVVDENVDAAPVRDDRGEHAVDRGAARHIDLDGKSLVAKFRGDLARLAARQIGDRDARALRDIARGDGAADAARPTGDEGGFSCQLHGAILRPSLSKR